MPSHEPRSPRATISRKSGAATGVVLTLALYKAYIFGAAHPQGYAASVCIDLTVVGVLVLIGAWGERRARAGARALASLAFYPLLALWFLTNFAYSYFSEAAPERHYSLLDVNWDQVTLFFKTLLPLTGWLWLIGLSLAAIAITRLSERRLRLPRTGAILLANLVLALFSGSLAWTNIDIPSPGVDIANDVKARLSEHRAEVDPHAAPAGPLSVLDRTQPAPTSLASRFDKVVVIVMETMPLDTYQEELSKLPPTAFLRRIAPAAHRWDRYFTANQDSRTAMVDMLGARFIPYEAYEDASEQLYAKSAKLANLPATLGALGWKTMYALAQEDQEIIVSDMPWSEVLSLTPERIAKHKAAGFQCYHPYEFENSCEDKVILPDLVHFLTTNPKAFVYQEMMWGHNLTYNEVSLKSNVGYVSEFADSIWTAMSRAGLAERTLLVITGDHGDKAEDRILNPLAYQVPLLMYSAGYTGARETRMYSHLDFQQLLFREMVPTRPPVPPVPFVHIIGPTSMKLHIAIDSTGGFLAWKQRGLSSYLQRAVPGRDGRTPDLSAQLRLFFDYKAAFEAIPTPP